MTTMTTTYTEALETQCKIMLNIARRLDEKGYAVIVYFLDEDGKHENYGYTHLLVSLKSFLKDRGRPRPTLIEVFPSGRGNPAMMEAARRDLKSADFSFRCVIPNRKKYQELHASLGLMSSTQKGRYGVRTGNGVLRAEKYQDSIRYQGSDKDALTVLLATLEMPQHRKILLGQ
jgi:hypothetical protein